MNVFDDACERLQISDSGRKKMRCPELSKRAKAKKNRQSGTEKIPKINCSLNMITQSSVALNV